ncbi:MAG: hypothetical protein AAB678_01985 [Patescibacteria group bacterium]
MFKKIIFSIAVLLAVTAFILPVFAQDFGLTETADKLGYAPSQKITIYSKVQTIVSVALSMVSIVFFILMTYAGVRWMTSRGNEELAAKAKHTLEAAVIGIIITVSAYAISNFVLSRLGGGSAGGGTAGGGAGASVTLCEKTYKAIGKNYFCTSADTVPQLCGGLQQTAGYCDGDQVCCHE